MKMLILAVSCLVSVTRLFAADSGKGPAPAKVDKPGREVDLVRLTLTAEAEKRLGVVTTPAVRKKLERVRRFGGELILPAPRSDAGRNAAALPLGVASSFTTTELMRIAQLQIDADGQVEQAKVQLEAARLVLNRAEQLLKDKAGSARALDEARVQVGMAEVNWRTARARRELLGPPVTEAVNQGELWVRVPVYVGELPRLQETAPARVGLLNDPPGASAELAPSVQAPPSANPSAATVDLFYVLTNRTAGWRLGQKVGATLLLREEEESLVVPWSAVVHDVHGGTWVYEKVEPSTFTRRRVEIARVTGADAVVARGLKSGAAIVSTGAAELFGTEFGVGK